MTWKELECIVRCEYTSAYEGTYEAESEEFGGNKIDVRCEEIGGRTYFTCSAEETERSLQRIISQQSIRM